MGHSSRFHHHHHHHHSRSFFSYLLAPILAPINNILAPIYNILAIIKLILFLILFIIIVILLLILPKSNIQMQPKLENVKKNNTPPQVKRWEFTFKV